MRENRLGIGVDFGVTTIRTGVVYQSHVIDHAPPLATREFDEPEALIDAISEAVMGLKEKHPGVGALGVGMPGFVDFGKGWVHSLTNVPEWVSVPLGKILERKTGMATVVDNRANCMAIAEWKCGAARGLDNVVFINLETGVGGAIIANGHLIRGSRHVAGEIGQSSLDWQGRKGEFGNPGAIEKYLGTAEIAADALEAYKAANITKTLPECTVGALIAAGHQKDPVALALWEKIARMLATVLSNSCWLLNPEAVVLAGSITRAGDLLFNPLREQLFSNLSHPFKDHLMVLQASFGHESGTIGAAALALEEVHLTV